MAEIEAPKTDSADEQVKVIERFYSSFANHDAAGMGACYHADVTFSDPVFTNLKGDEARGMWTMLVSTGKDMTLVYDHVTSNSAHWVATYTFSKTGRRVVNDITAKFEFRDGLIVNHVDTFDFWRWAGMALGLTGTLLGWTPFLHNSVKTQARARLDTFMSKSRSTGSTQQVEAPQTSADPNTLGEPSQIKSNDDAEPTSDD